MLVLIKESFEGAYQRRGRLRVSRPKTGKHLCLGWYAYQHAEGKERVDKWCVEPPTQVVKAASPQAKHKFDATRRERRKSRGQLLARSLTALAGRSAAREP